jgi:hypothetical protein
LRRTQAEMEDHLDDQGARDGSVGVQSRTSTTRTRRAGGAPTFDGLFVDPERQAASSNQGTGVLGPVADSVPEDEVAFARRGRILRWREQSDEEVVQQRRSGALSASILAVGRPRAGSHGRSRQVHDRSSTYGSDAAVRVTRRNPSGPHLELSGR